MLLIHLLFRDSNVDTLALEKTNSVDTLAVKGLLTLLTLLIHFPWTLCWWVTYKDMIAIPYVVDGSCISTFLYKTSYTCVSCSDWLIASWLLRAWCRMFGFQATDTHTPFLTHHSQKHMTATKWPQIQMPSVFSFITSFGRNHGFVCYKILTVVCGSYMWIHILVCLIIVKLKFWRVTVSSPQPI
jgi:hypothetical protein